MSNSPIPDNSQQQSHIQNDDTKARSNKSNSSLRKESSKIDNELNHKDAAIDVIPGKRSILKTIRNLFIKASLNLSLAKSKLRQFTEEALSSDEIINELFLVTSSSSVASSLLEPDDTENNQSTNNVPTLSETQESDISLPRFIDFDAVKEASKLRKQDIPFHQGDLIWLKRREIWLNSTEKDKLKIKQRQTDNQQVTNLNIVGKENYALIYESLIDKSKTLKKPMNLKDAIKVIDSSWSASRKWDRATQGLVV